LFKINKSLETGRIKMSSPIKVGRLPNSVKSALKKKQERTRKRIPNNMFAGCDSIPDRIIIYFDKKIEYDKIDKTIKFKFQKLKETIPQLESKQKRYEKELEEERDVSKIMYLKKEIKKISDTVEDYQNDISIGKYIELTKSVLEQIELTPDSVSQSLMDSYFSVAKRYISIDIIREVSEESKCINCGEHIDDDTNIDNIVICPNCDAINTIMRLTKFTRDVEYGNTVYDEDITNFIKVLEKFEGKNSTPIHESLYDELDVYMKSIDIKTGEFYRNLPLNDEGKKEGTSKRLLWQALERLKYNQYYDEINRIAHVYWGYDLPDLSHYRDQLIEDYQNTQTVWKRIKKDYDRSASLGTQYRLYKHLLAVGYPNCKREDFRIQEMIDSLRLHDHAWKRMCEETGVKFFPTSC
jgi:ssDNA-binding Zn-finger/Zn-ribbon topoisomerase 1